MSKVSFGVGLFGTQPSSRMVRLAQVAEDVGFETAWIGDSNMIWREVYVLMGAMACQTSRIALGPGVTHPRLRHPAITASAMVTLAELTDGRAKLGIGIGATGPANLGLAPVRIGELKTAIEQIRGLMRGETVDLDGFDGRISYAKHDIPIYVAASSRKTLGMVGEIADGAICGSKLYGSPISVLREAQQKAGRAPESVRAMNWEPCSIAEDPAEAFHAVKAMVARTALVEIGIHLKHGRHVDEQDRVDWQKLRDHYDTMKHMEMDHAHLVQDRWVSKMSISGTAEQVREQVQARIAEGWDEISIVPFGKDPEAIIRTFGEQVIAKV